jgi:serine/threonine protein kinase
MGIEYLHERGIVHADLKGVSPGSGTVKRTLIWPMQTNVMIDDQGHAKLIDFGLARVIDAKPGLTTSTTTTIRWCAPELIRSDDARMTKSSDVYAFASTVLEVGISHCPGDQFAS